MDISTLNLLIGRFRLNISRQLKLVVLVFLNSTLVAIMNEHDVVKTLLKSIFLNLCQALINAID
jgi:hypothetical protein